MQLIDSPFPNTIALCLLAAAVLSSPVCAGDWTQFRGPNGNGVANEANLPVALDQKENLGWKISLPGEGLSSPIVVGQRVFITCSSGPKQTRLHILCFNASDGSKLWERQFWATGRTMCHEKTSVAAPTPASDGQRIFALFSSNDLICLDLDGNLLWLRGITRDYPNASNSLGMSSSPVVSGGVLIVQVENDSESFAAGLDVHNGLNLWKIDRPKKANWTSPVILTRSQGSPLVALQSSAGISAVDPATGKEVWNYSDGASTIPSSSPDADVLYVPSHGLTALQHLPGSSSPKQLWRSGQLRPGTASPVIHNKQVFTVNEAGVLTSGDALTGERLWQLRLKGPFSATPVLAGDLLFLVNEKGLTQVVDLGGSEGQLVGQVDLQETILSTPSIAHGALFLRSDGYLWKFTKS